MQQKNIISISKIFFIVAFIGLLLIVSLFMFHLRYKSKETVLSPDIGVIFSPSRDIKSFDLVTAQEAPFKLKNFYQHWTLLFFGFTHCGNVCPMMLDLIQRAYSKLHPHYPTLQVVFITLDPDRDDPTSLQKYLKSFNPAFIGATGAIQEIHKLQSQFGIYAARDGNDVRDSYQIQHTASLMLINPQGKWAGLFHYGLKPQQLVEGVEKTIERYPDGYLS